MRYMRCDEKFLGAEYRHRADRHRPPSLRPDEQATSSAATIEPGAARVQADHLTDREQHRHRRAREELQAPARRAQSVGGILGQNKRHSI